MLTDQELRQAVFAMTIIDIRGDRDEFDAIMFEASNKSPAADEYEAMPLGTRITARTTAKQLSKLLGEREERCHQAAIDALGTCRQRLRFTALVRYAIELIGPCRELTGESLFVPHTSETEQKEKAKPIQRQTVRIVGARGVLQ